MTRSRYAGLQINVTVSLAAMALMLLVETSFAEGLEKTDSEAPTLEELVRNHDRIEGLFTFFRDKVTGALLMQVAADQIDKEFIYHAQTLNGPSDAGFRFTKGVYNDEIILSVRRRYNKLEFIHEVTGFHSNPASAIARAAGANLVPAILAVADIIAASPDGTRLLIDADPIFLTEAFLQVTQSPTEKTSKETITLGTLSAEKTHLLEVRAFPKNANVVVAYSFDQDAPASFGGHEVADARNITVTVQHSFIEMPDEKYRPRSDDQRIGYFTTPVTDLSSTHVAPHLDVINRWRLEKKNPEAAISEPVKPVTFWIENTTPREYREAVRKGILTWNQAFEKIGFRNAIVVRIQPDDAEWDASDIRYNVLRWVASPQPLYSGFGPSFTNPRTGEIIAADIMFEFNAISKRIKEARAFAADSQRPDSALNEEIARIVQQGIQGIVVHEVGHALGLMHNMKASQMLSLEDLREVANDPNKPHVSSVMDYDPLNYSSDRSRQGNYSAIVLGPYDYWAIEYGYHPALKDPEAEKSRVDVLLARSTRPELAFANDADSIFPGMGIDPRAMAFDLSSDAISFAEDRIELVDGKLDELVEAFGKRGGTWDDLRSAYLILTADRAISASIISRYIGGVYIERSVVGQPGEKTPFTPVSFEDQKRAMGTLSKHIFAPEAFSPSPELIRRLQVKRRGEERLKNGGETEDPKIHEYVVEVQARVLAQLLHPIVLSRMTDSALYGNEYSPSHMMGDLTDAIFAADLRGTVNSFRQNLQAHYVEQLIDIAAGTSEHDQIARSAADHSLRQIGRMMRTGKRPDIETTAHRNRLQALVEVTLRRGPSRSGARSD